MPFIKDRLYKITALEHRVFQEYYDTHIDKNDAKILVNYYTKRLTGNPLDAVAAEKIKELTK